jgi:L-fuconolactonase
VPAQTFKTVLAAFGHDRLLFGGDWPVSTPATDYLRWIDTVNEFAGAGSEADRTKLFQSNAERIYLV